LSQVRTGNFRKIISTFEVAQPFDEVVSILSYKAKHKQVSVDINFVNLEPDTLIRTDKRRIMQVVLNLVSNALKFTSRDGKIQIKCKMITN
jgi:signal transduction histidine kinase